MTARTISVIVFPGGFNLPLWAGIEREFFRARGLELQLRYTTNSVEQLTTLIDGSCDIGLTGFDNIVAYQEGQGEAPTQREPDLFAFMGGDSAFLRLVVQADIRGYSDLAGQTLSVDAMTTGFAFVLRRMLARNGLSETDVRFERAGGVLQRFEALQAGKHAGTLLLTPFELMAQRRGLHVLQPASAVLPNYQGISGATRRSWAKENSETLVAFIRAYLDALAWLYEPRNRSAACMLMIEKVPGMTSELATEACAVLLDPEGGFEPAARLDRAGMLAVLSLRSEYGRPQKLLSDPDKYSDASYYERAASR